MEITKAQPSHISGIVELWKELMDFHKALDPFFTRSEEGHVSFGRHTKKLLESEDALVLVALDKGNIIGYAISEIVERPPVFQRRKYGIISDMAVKSTHRRKGIGEQMLKKLLKWFQLQNISRIELRVVVQNKIGYSFWKKHGFNDYMHVSYLNRETQNGV